MGKHKMKKRSYSDSSTLSMEKLIRASDGDLAAQTNGSCWLSYLGLKYCHD
ncbi:hypothetical protein LguiB_027472 [Lonicera macranthoides]